MQFEYSSLDFRCDAINDNRLTVGSKIGVMPNKMLYKIYICIYIPKCECPHCSSRTSSSLHHSQSPAIEGHFLKATLLPSEFLKFMPFDVVLAMNELRYDTCL